MPPTGSIIIPCYNRAHFIGGAIESVLRQTYQSFEIIVVDDGSTDETAQAVAVYPQVQLIRQSNSGTAAARNTGLGAARGEYVVFLDSDDLLLPDALQIGVDALAHHPDCAFVYGYCQYIAADGSRLPTPYRPRVRKDYYRHLLRQNFIQSNGVVMYRRSAVDGFHLATNGCEDWDLYLRIAKDHKIHCHEQEVLQYRRHSSSMSGDHKMVTKAAIVMFQSHLELVQGDTALEKLCRAKLKALDRELAGKRDVKRDILTVLRIAGYEIAKLFGRKP